MELLSQICRPIQALVPTATASSATKTTATIDMTLDGGYDGCLFIWSLSAPATDTTAKVQSSATDFSGSDVAGTLTTSTATSKNLIIDVYRPQTGTTAATAVPAKYLQSTCTIGTTTSLTQCTAILYRGRALPPGTTTLNVIKQTISALQGTA